MNKYYVIEEKSENDDCCQVSYILDDVLFDTVDKAKNYILNSLKEHRNGKWEINEFSNSEYYSVELYINEEDSHSYWADVDFYITELILQ